MATLTLKDVPDALLAKLMESAKLNDRSLEREIITRLQSGFAARVIDVREQARRLKAFTDGQSVVDHAHIDRFKRQGRM
jgi:hypothetical protein